jgi:hypothetical protein
MPLIVNGGENIFGWSIVGNDGKIVIPPEAFEEYLLNEDTRAILIPGSKISGGFGLSSKRILKNSTLKDILDKNPLLAEYKIPEGEVMRINRKKYCWVSIQKDGSIILPQKTMKGYEINPGDYLLSVRGSNLAIGFVARGPIYFEARRYQDIKEF